MEVIAQDFEDAGPSNEQQNTSDSELPEANMGSESTDTLLQASENSSVDTDTFR